MSWGSGELVGALAFLLPGFVAAAIYYALTWCRAAGELTGEDWRYLKVTEALFDFADWESLAALERGARTHAP